VFRWSITTLAPVARQVLAAAAVQPAELGAFVPHQANLRIVDSLARSLELPEHVAVAREVREMGNTSAASVPLAMEQLRCTGQVRSGDLALLLGFGSGLGYAGQVVRLP
jgi:3-oxoacyl-[acyl-carrier-protein] synthase-3